MQPDSVINIVGNAFDWVNNDKIWRSTLPLPELFAIKGKTNSLEVVCIIFHEFLFDDSRDLNS